MSNFQTRFDSFTLKQQVQNVILSTAFFIYLTFFFSFLQFMYFYTALFSKMLSLSTPFLAYQIWYLIILSLQNFIYIYQGVWEFLFSADILFFWIFFAPKFQLFLLFSAYFSHFYPISCCFSLFFVCGLSHTWYIHSWIS